MGTDYVQREVCKVQLKVLSVESIAKRGMMEAPHVKKFLLQARQPGCRVPLTAFQRRTWDSHAAHGIRLTAMRMCASSLRIMGRLDTGILRKSIRAVVGRHESLRTRIAVIDGAPVQCIEEQNDDPLRLVQLQGSISQKDDLIFLVQEFFERKIDLTVGPLFEAKLFKLSDDDHVLTLALDHMIADGASCAILVREIWLSYSLIEQGQALLPPLPIQFADYAVWQEKSYEGWLLKHGPYWREHLAGAPHIQPKYDGYSPAAENPVGETLHMSFSASLVEELRQLAVRERTLLPLVVFAIFSILISRWCDQEEFVLGFISHGRYGSPALENMIGMLEHCLVLRVQVQGTSSFTTVLRQLSLEFHTARQHQDFDRLPDLMPESIPDLSFNWMPRAWAKASDEAQHNAIGPLSVKPFPVENRSPPPAFWPIFSEVDNGIYVNIRYRTNLFSRRTAERFGRNLQALAAHFVAQPQATIESVDLVL